MSDCHHSEGEISKATAHAHRGQPAVPTDRHPHLHLPWRAASRQQPGSCDDDRAYGAVIVGGSPGGSITCIAAGAGGSIRGLRASTMYAIPGSWVDASIRRDTRGGGICTARASESESPRTHERVSPALQVMRGCRGGS